MPILAIGSNAKLGKRIASYSRPVGPTCPSDCPFLTGTLPSGETIPKGQRCYAESIQKRYTSVKEAWGKNANAVWEQWQGAFLVEFRKASKKVDALRIHVGGDWVQGDKVDRPYLAALLRSLRKARNEGITTPAWYYTHAWNAMARHKKYLTRLGVQGFASVHDRTQAEQASSQGWRLAIDCGESIKAIKPGFREIHGVRSLSCPEQAKQGAIQCDACKYCWKQTSGNVTFWRH